MSETPRDQHESFLPVPPSEASPEPAGCNVDEGSLPNLPPKEALASHPPVEASAECACDPSESIPSATQSAAVAEPAPAPPIVQSGTITPGGIHHATVIEVDTHLVHLKLSDQVQGTVAILEFAGHPTPKVGDEVSVIVEQYDPATNQVTLSKRHADEELFWHSVRPGDMLEGVVTGMNKGGLDIDLGGARAFLPASQVDLHRMKDISLLIGEHVRVAVVQVDRVTKDLIVSRRKVQEEDRVQERRMALESLVEGQSYPGKISNLTEYGAFVNLDAGVDGLIHITDLSWGRVTNPSDFVKPGQEVTVKLLKVDREKGKVSLGLKQMKANPWDDAEQRYPAGSRIKVKIARLADFGAFVQLEEGVDALLPASEISWSRRIANPMELVKVGDEIEAAILKVEPAKQRISISLKQIQDDPWSSAETRFPVNGTLKGKVSKIMDFGAFVEVAPGVEGLVHISELSERRVNAVSDVVKEGQDVDVRVLKLDIPAQRLSLSMKPEPKLRIDSRADDTRRPKKDRKKPLRGGLASHFDW